MKILKFGGTSVADHQNIQKSISIIKENTGKKVVVVSALCGVTDAFIETINKAKARDQNYRKSLSDIKDKHLEVLINLLSAEKQKKVSIILKKALLTWKRYWKAVIY